MVLSDGFISFINEASKINNCCEELDVEIILTASIDKLQLQPLKCEPTRLEPTVSSSLAKTHKPAVPVQPVLSMPGSAYYNIANQVTELLSFDNECKTNCSTKSIADILKDKS